VRHRGNNIITIGNEKEMDVTVVAMLEAGGGGVGAGEAVGTGARNYCRHRAHGALTHCRQKGFSGHTA